MARDAEVELRVLEVDNRSPNSAFRGVPQAKGLKRCWEEVGVPGAFEYIVRVRTDVYHGFAMPERLPRGAASVAYVGFLGAQGCSPLRRSALWVDDRFAVLRGREAQRVFLHDFAESLEKLPLTTQLHGTAPECLLGIDVDVANARGGETAVKLRDVRGLIARGSGICRRAAGLIIRSDNCSAEVRRAVGVPARRDAAGVGTVTQNKNYATRPRPPRARRRRSHARPTAPRRCLKTGAGTSCADLSASSSRCPQNGGGHCSK